LPGVQRYEAAQEEASRAQCRRLTVHTSFIRHGLELHEVVTSSARYRYRLLATRYHRTRRLSIKIAFYHRLNGSSSHVFTATSLCYGKAKNSTPAESKYLTRLR